MPGEITNWQGLIAPNGDFYVCKFGEHNSMAYAILKWNHNKFGYTLEEVRSKFDDALATIIDHGWAATRWLAGSGHYVTHPTRLTKAQKNTIWDAIVKFDCYIDDPELL